MVDLQLWLHKFDQFQQGLFYRRVRTPVLCVLILSLWVGYNLRCSRNMTAPEGMDAAQVARNIAEGRGFSTKFIRPLSVHYLMERNDAKLGVTTPSGALDRGSLRENHPDLANAPLYPLALAGLMKTIPFQYEINLKSRFWSAPPIIIPQRVRDAAKTQKEKDDLLKRQETRQFLRYQPDFLISLFNQLLFCATVVLFYFLGKRLFDEATARTATVLLIGSELLWRFTMSGLSTHLLMLIFMGIVWCLVLLEAESHEPKRTMRYQFQLAIAIGLLAGLGFLTRYSFGWIIIPALLFVRFYLPTHRAALGITIMAVFGVTIVPWIYRNMLLCGLPFGTATVAPLEATSFFAGYRLQRSIDPNWNRSLYSTFGILWPFIHKLLNGLRQIVLTDLIHLGGGWASSFFLVGLLQALAHRSRRHLRYFLVITLGCFAIVQALARTQISSDVPEVNSENLIVILFPLVLLYGVSLFHSLLDQINFIHRVFRLPTTLAFILIMCLPMVTAFLPPRVNPIVYPPYYPPAIRQTAGFMKENELMMGDIPWAVAWYGNRQCIWLTLNAQDDFFAINDGLKPIRGLYLTPLTMDSRFLTEWVWAGEHSWGNFVFETILRHEVPGTFPLRSAPDGYLPEQFFISDWERWKLTGQTNGLAPAR